MKRQTKIGVFWRLFKESPLGFQNVTFVGLLVLCESLQSFPSSSILPSEERQTSSCLLLVWIVPVIPALWSHEENSGNVLIRCPFPQWFLVAFERWSTFLRAWTAASADHRGHNIRCAGIKSPPKVLLWHHFFKKTPSAINKTARYAETNSSLPIKCVPMLGGKKPAGCFSWQIDRVSKHWAPTWLAKNAEQTWRLEGFSWNPQAPLWATSLAHVPCEKLREPFKNRECRSTAPSPWSFPYCLKVF